MKPLVVIAMLAVASPRRARPAETERHAELSRQAGRHARDDRRRVLRRSQPRDVHHRSRTSCSTRVTLMPGERLKIPVTREITTAKGDTFESLAAHVSRRSRGARRFSPTSTDCRPTRSLIATGTPLAIPFHVTHTAAGTETLAQIAAAYFGDAKQADVLRALQLPRQDLAREGRVDRRADLHVHVRAGKLPPIDAESTSARDDRQRSASDAADAALAASAHRVAARRLRGRHTALARGRRSSSTTSTSPTAVEVGVLLGKAVRRDRRLDAGGREFTQVCDRKPRHALSRVRRVAEDARGMEARPAARSSERTACSCCVARVRQRCSGSAPAADRVRALARRSTAARRAPRITRDAVARAPRDTPALADEAPQRLAGRRPLLTRPGATERRDRRDRRCRRRRAADARGARPAARAARRRGVDLVVALGGMGATAGRARGDARRARRSRDVAGRRAARRSRVRARADAAIAGAARRGDAVLDGRLVRWIELPGATIATSPAAGAVAPASPAPTAAPSGRRRRRASLAELAARPGLRIAATAEAPRAQSSTASRPASSRFVAARRSTSCCTARRAARRRLRRSAAATARESRSPRAPADATARLPGAARSLGRACPAPIRGGRRGAGARCVDARVTRAKHRRACRRRRRKNSCARGAGPRSTEPSHFCRECGADMTRASALDAARAIRARTDSSDPQLDAAPPSADRRLTDSNQAWLGKVVDGRYRVLEVIGRGGMGVVYRVEHLRMGKVAAMKVLHRDLAQRRRGRAALRARGRRGLASCTTRTPCRCSTSAPRRARCT